MISIFPPQGTLESPQYRKAGLTTYFINQLSTQTFFQTEKRLRVVTL